MTDGNFEAKLCAIRKNKDGLVVSLVVHPHDAGHDLMTLDIGARVMIGWAECTDAPDDTKLTVENIPDRNKQAILGTGPYAPKRERTPFAELPLSQQAGMLCKDEAFRAWLARKEGVPCSVDVALLVVRGECGVNSRAELDEPQNGEARARWLALYDDFAAWKLTQAYAETIR